MQKLTIIGNLVADPERKATRSGKELATFTLAVNERHGGETDTTYFNCTAWEKKAIPILQFSKKGSKMYIEGSVRATPYMSKKTGQPSASLDVTVFNYEFLSSKRSDADEEGYNPTQGMTVVNDDDVPF